MRSAMTSAPAAAASPARPARGALTVVTYVLFAVMLGGTAPTPIYAIYAHRLHLAPPAISVVFAAYAAGILLALLLFGGVSDYAGRRITLGTACAVSVASSTVFALFPVLPGLLAGRLLSGVSVGLCTGAATAYFAELHPDRTRAALIASVTNMAGLGVGPLLSGFLVQYLPHPTAVPYLALITLQLPGLLLVRLPEPVADRRLRIRPQRLRVPASTRRPFTAAAVAVFAAFALLGLLAALTGDFLTDGLHDSSHLLVGAVVFSAFGAAGAVQLLVVRLRPSTGSVLGMVAIPVGVALLVLALAAHSLPLFLTGALVGGSGAGAAFKSGLAMVVAAASKQQAGEAASGYFFAAYLGLTLPVIGVAVLVTRSSLLTAAGCFAGVIAVLSAVSVACTVRLDRVG
ncbi:MFS transporter [Kitasatospora viridis]|uniref:Putative MFS family arabinose efflux permease n=1 Tax=Kitasatospora viridis TaxID=281105 RepID=A0A561UCP0_9ACTN|nr:MFS transporter [Kitasatospora viridis]TWF97142.1 putative MFS family arabinose efflux permease [Kitasatospora viridis]